MKLNTKCPKCGGVPLDRGMSRSIDGIVKVRCFQGKGVQLYFKGKRYCNTVWYMAAPSEKIGQLAPIGPVIRRK